MNNSNMGCGKDLGQNAMCQVPTNQNATLYILSFWFPLIGIFLSFTLKKPTQTKKHMVHISIIGLLLQCIILLLIIL